MSNICYHYKKLLVQLYAIEKKYGIKYGIFYGKPLVQFTPYFMHHLHTIKTPFQGSFKTTSLICLFLAL